MDAYLQLSAAEMAVYNREVAALEVPEREAVLQIVNQWEARGEARGKSDIVFRQIRRRVGAVPEKLVARIAVLSVAQLDALADALLDFTDVADVQAWLATNA